MMFLGFGFSDTIPRTGQPHDTAMATLGSSQLRATPGARVRHVLLGTARCSDRKPVKFLQVPRSNKCHCTSLIAFLGAILGYV